jgi:putative membrane protein
MRKQFAIFLMRWVCNSFGLWLASRLFDGGFNDTDATAATFLIAGLVLSLVNSLLKPIIIILSLPAILLTLGLFMLVVNGLSVYIALKLVPGLEVTFVVSIIVGIIISLINYALSAIIDLRTNPREKYL